jgi:glucosylceramidase
LPGAVRVYSSNGAGIVSAAFVNRDGSRALVAFNDSSERRSFQARWGTRVFTTALPAFSGATFVWSGAQNGETVVSARDRIQASSFHETSGLQTETSSDTPGGFNVGYAEDGDFALYRGVDFGRRVTAVDVRVASAGSGGTLEFRVDAPEGPVIATAALPVTGGWQEWTTVTAPVARVSGRRDLYLVLHGQGQIGNVNWFRFR